MPATFMTMLGAPQALPLIRIWSAESVPAGLLMAVVEVLSLLCATATASPLFDPL